MVWHSLSTGKHFHFTQHQMTPSGGLDLHKPPIDGFVASDGFSLPRGAHEPATDFTVTISFLAHGHSKNSPVTSATVCCVVNDNSPYTHLPAHVDHPPWVHFSIHMAAVQVTRGTFRFAVHGRTGTLARLVGRGRGRPAEGIVLTRWDCCVLRRAGKRIKSTYYITLQNLAEE